MPDDEDEYYDDRPDRPEYDIHDPRTREHTAYKISQDNAIAAQRRFEEVEGVGREALEERLRNAKEARGWAHDAATRRGEWAGQWTGTTLDDDDDPSGVLQQEDQLNVQVERWNAKIKNLERQREQIDAGGYTESEELDQSDDGEEGYSDDQTEPDPKGLLDARSARERRHVWSDEDDGEEDGGGKEEGDDDDHDEYEVEDDMEEDRSESENSDLD